MKARHTLGIIGALLTVAGVAGAQMTSDTVGLPMDTSENPGGGVVVLVARGIEGQAIPVLGPSDFPYTTVFPGDRVLVNSTGGNDPSNWLAVLRFFNPSDPSGSQGLAATEIQTYFPADVTGGFAAFSLFPQYNLVPASIDQFGQVTGTDSIFGPQGGIEAGQLAVYEFIALPAAVTPEPGSVALLVGMGLTGAGFLARRRRSVHKAA